MARELTPAFAYLRTSSAANVGPDKDSERRQREAIDAFARRAGFTVVAAFYDAAVSGAEPINERPGFTKLLDAIAGNGVRAIIVESPDRFARDLAVQLAGHDMLKALGIDLLPASAPDFFTEDTPTAEMVRQVLGAIAQFEKANLVAKLKAARNRKRKEAGRCEGRKPHAKTRPDVVERARELRKGTRKTPGLSLRQIAATLAAEGMFNEKKRPFHPKSIQAMLDGPRPPAASPKTSAASPQSRERS